jgi:hypothetical protein
MEGPVSEGAQMTPAYVRGLESRIVELLGRIEQLEVFFAAHPDGWPLHPDHPADLQN